MKTLLIDGPNLTVRAIKAVTYGQVEMTSDGVNTGPLVIFLNSLLRHLREEKPDRVAVYWEGGGSDYRQQLYPDYKANRTPMLGFEQELKQDTFSRVRRFLVLAGIPQVERRGFEADDLIATEVARARPGDHVVMLTSDKDFLQLVQDAPVRVEQVRLSSSGTETDRWNSAKVTEHYGCSPEHLAFAMALAGDTADNIVGVPRFGMKTAVKELAKADWDLEAVDHYAVVLHRDRVQMNLKLIDLRSPPPVQLPELPRFTPTAPGSPLYTELVDYLDLYQLNGIKRRLYDGNLWSSSL